MSSLAPRSYTLEYPYTRTVGPVVGKFLTGLRDGRLFGIRCRGKVICPPIEFDPESGETLPLDFVEVGPGGVVESWTWIAEPTRKHPFQRPFAFALIRLDGADTAIVHAVAASGPDAMSRGLRVRAQYKKERTSAITDVWFAPEAEAADSFVPATGQGDVTITDHLISLVYEEPLTAARERYAQGLLAGRFIGQKSPKTGKVFVPSSGYDPLARALMTEADDVELPGTGTVVGFTVITPVQYYGQKETEPYIRASILLDGADTALGQQDIRDIPVAEFRVGLRVRAVFRPPNERSVDELTNRWAGTGSCIARWERTGEPDVPEGQIKGGLF
jgi:uncharacterized OB-fold protein